MLRPVLVEGLSQPCQVLKFEHIMLNRIQPADCQYSSQFSVPETVSYYIWACGYSFIRTDLWLSTSLKVQTCNLLIEQEELRKAFVSFRVRNG
jgi:hypothetical protein